MRSETFGIFRRMSASPASYYNDGRDILEAAYPTSTSFARYHSHPTLAGFERRRRGVALVLSLHSESAIERFRSVCYALEDSVSWDNFCFDVYDFNGIVELLPTLSACGPVTGAGEAFWVLHGHIVAAMISDYDATHFEKITADLISA
jgi:hypothetical protein